MLIEGNKTNPCRSCSGSRNLATHLLRQDTNEKVAVLETKGLASETLEGAFREINAHAIATKATLSAYHAKICPQIGEHLSDEQVLKAADRLEKEMGFTDQARAVVRHEKNGREHYHVVWSRIDLEKLRAIDTPNNYEKHEKVAKELEQEFGLAETRRAHGREAGVERPEHNAEKWEYQQADRLKTKGPRIEKQEITQIYKESKNGKELTENLAKAGYALAKGEKEGVFLVVNKRGGWASLTRRVEGTKKADIVEKLADLKNEKLPDLAQAKEQQKKKLDAAQKIEATKKNLTKLAKDTKKVGKEGLRVTGCTVRGAGKLLDKAADVAEAVLSIFDPPTPRTYSPQEIYQSKEAEKDFARQLDAKKESKAALGRIAESVRKDKTLAYADLRQLQREDLEQIKQRGDEGLLALCRQLEAEQKKQRERLRER